MNLVKLLKVGRSLNGGKSLFGKYKMAQQTLPRFASTVRPTRSAPALESLLEKAKSASPAAVAQEAAQPAFVTSVLDKTQKIPAGKILRRMDAPVLIKRGGFVFRKKWLGKRGSQMKRCSSVCWIVSKSGTRNGLQQ